MRVVIGQIMHETNTFSGVKTTIASFKKGEWAVGEQMISNHRKVRTYTGGMIDRAEELQIEVIPTFGASAIPAGRIASDAYEAMKLELLQGIGKAGSFNAVCLSLHGAGVAEGMDDIEGDLIQSVRQLIGRAIPLVVTLDLHANMTQLMVDEADLIIGDNYYPHIDSYERGREAIDRTVQLLKGEIQPVMHLTKTLLMIPTSGTKFHPVNLINALCLEYEKAEDVLDCTLFHGFPYSDIYAAGLSVLTTTNNNKPLAEHISDLVAEKALEHKHDFFPRHPKPEEGIKLALESSAQPVVINETSDNPGGGTPGDGTHLLRAMLESGLEDACFAYIYDPEVAEIAHKAGVGANITIQLGGKTDMLHGAPITMDAYVKVLSDGKFTISSPMGKGTKLDLGKSVRLYVNGVDILVCSICNQVFDEQVFLLHGIDIRQYKIVALKSSHHFRAAFEPLSERIITVDSPGLSMIDFTQFPFQHVNRPIYPLDA